MPAKGCSQARRDRARGRSVSWSAGSAGRRIRTGSRTAGSRSSYGQRRHPDAPRTRAAGRPTRAPASPTLHPRCLRYGQDQCRPPGIFVSMLAVARRSHRRRVIRKHADARSWPPRSEPGLRAWPDSDQEATVTRIPALNQLTGIESQLPSSTRHRPGRRRAGLPGQRSQPITGVPGKGASPASQADSASSILVTRSRPRIRSSDALFILGDSWPDEARRRCAAPGPALPAPGSALTRHSSSGGSFIMSFR